MRLLKRARSFCETGASERRIFVETAALSVFVFAGFRIAGVSRTQAYLRRWAVLRARQGVEFQLSLAEEGRIVECATRSQSRLSRLVGNRGTCLERSFALWAVLLKRGVSTDLKIGFRKTDRIEGHAWIEHRGFPINELSAIVSDYETSQGSMHFDKWRPT